ncbi:MAG: lipid II:glycine glycyltransferase FemX [Patescibacteria group bacterium]
MEIQQSELYAKYIASLGWKVIKIGQTQIFLKHFPLVGGLAKIQRCTQFPDATQIINLLKENKVRRLAVEPASNIKQNQFDSWLKKLSQHFYLTRTPFLPTKTLIIDLTPTEKQIFKSFNEAKRRAVRRAQKNNLLIYESANVQELIKIKNKSAGFLGFITTFGVRELWKAFAPSHATILLAYSPESLPEVVGGLLLLFGDHTAYYWLAGATRKGKKMFAPTLLAWEALKLAKNRGCTRFDFVGVWDERLPKQNNSWRGFTKFKEGFGGFALYYPL